MDMEEDYHQREAVMQRQGRQLLQNLNEEEVDEEEKFGVDEEGGDSGEEL